MTADEQLQLAIDKQDPEEAGLALDRLQQQVVEAMQSGDAERMHEVEDGLAVFLRVWRRLLNAEDVNASLIVGEVAGMHEVLRALREDKPLVADLKAVRSRRYAGEFLLALRTGVALRGKDILQRTSIPDQPAVSQLGAYLEKTGLVRRDRSGKGAPYWLTRRGNLVAKHLLDEADAEARLVDRIRVWRERAPHSLLRRNDVYLDILVHVQGAEYIIPGSSLKGLLRRYLEEGVAESEDVAHVRNRTEMTEEMQHWSRQVEKRRADAEQHLEVELYAKT